MKMFILQVQSGVRKIEKDHLCRSWASPNCTGLEGKYIRDLVTMRTVGLKGQLAQKTVTFTRFQSKIRNVSVCRIQVALHILLKVAKKSTWGLF